MKINLGTQEEETAEEPNEHLQWRQKKSTADHAGKQSGPEKDRTPIPRTEGPEPRVEAEPVQTELVTEVPAPQAPLAGQSMTRPVIQEPVIQLSTPPAHQDQPEPERPTEAQPEPELPSGNQPEPELPTRQDQPLASAEIGQPSALTQQQGTGSQWLRWIGEQIAGVVHYMEAEEKAQVDRLLATTGELEKARSRIRSLEQELEIAKEELAKMVITGPQEQEPVAPVHVQNNETPATVHNNTTPVPGTNPDIITAQAQELAVLKEDLAAQEALRARERELKMAAEEEQRKTADNLRRAEESLRKGHQAYDRLKEEKEKVLQEKDKLRRMAETEIERLKEELRQQKDREDRARRQINQKLKQKTEDFDRLHRDYKHVETEYKKLITDSDQQQEKMFELRNEVQRAETALAEERAEKETIRAEAAQERMELQMQHQGETERATMVLQRVQTTYQNQLVRYKDQEVVTANLIKQLKDDRQAAEDKSKMGLERIRCIVHAWKNRTKRLIEDNSVLWWSKWAKHAAELQLLRADAENRQREGDEFYKLEKEDFAAVKDELAEDFVALVDEQITNVRQLVAQLDDDRLDNQIQFESYEKERLRQEATKSTTTINLSDEEPSSDQGTDRAKAGTSQPDVT